jgi:hypothetical protein
VVRVCEPARGLIDTARVVKPKLRLLWQAIPGLTWLFCCISWVGSDYFKVSGMGAPIRSKASRWMLVGSASVAMVAVAAAKRTWLRVRVARWVSRPRKLR